MAPSVAHGPHVHVGRVANQEALRLTFRNVPDADHLPPQHVGEDLAVRAEDHIADLVRLLKRRAYRLPGGRGAELFAQLQVINLFNQFQLCACGATAFGTGNVNAGGMNIQRIDTTVLTPVTTPARFAAFNPFTTTPVQGVNWDYGPNFGRAVSRFAYTTPQSLRLSFGVRF